MITKERIIQEAKELRCEPAALIAVDTVESGGKGFYQDGKTPIILFEPHIFWKELKKMKIDPQAALNANRPKYQDILYPIWKPGAYGPSNTQHERMSRAVTIHREAALKSASWGRYQILGNNYKLAGCDTFQEFINKIYKSEDEHMDLFTAFVRNTYLDDELRALDFDGFARGFNGPLWYRNDYGGKLRRAYKKAKLAGW